MRLISCCMALLGALLAALATDAFTAEAWAANRAYVMNGLFVGTGLAAIAARLRERRYIVAYGSFEQDREFAADACAHPADRIVVIGHSFGAERAAKVATQVAACGARDVTLIGIHPAAPAAVSGVAHAVNFVGIPRHDRRRAKHPGPRLHPYGHHGKSGDAGAHPAGSGVGGEPIARQRPLPRFHGGG